MDSSLMKGDKGGEKLRKACNECNAAKTRCSGERTGCNRCKASDLHCIYEQSRVGKVPGVRAKGAANKQQSRNHTPNKRYSNGNNPLSSPLGDPLPQHGPSSSSSSVMGVGSGAMQTGGGGVGHNSSAHHYFENPVLEGWSTGLSRHSMDRGHQLPSDDMDDMFDGTFELEHPPYHQMHPSTSSSSNMRSAPSLSTASTDLIDPSLDFEFDDVPEPSSVATSTTSEMQRPPRGVTSSSSGGLPRQQHHSHEQQQQQQQQQHHPPSAPSQAPLLSPSQMMSAESNRSSSDSQCILACCSIVTNLETYIDARIKVLDLALDVVRKAVTSVTQIIDQGSSSRCCHMLLGAIMYQVVLVLERGCITFLEQHHAAVTGSSASLSGASGSNATNAGGLPQFDSVGGMLSGFGFSGFRVDAGEQRAWRARVVLKEIRQVNEILKRITALATRDLVGTVGGREMTQLAEENCHHDVIVRLECLAGQLEKVQNSG
ncbi:MAG: hypothetical protein MMC33_002271 [Icmadophila ericetorum]|nr:hypothetical protein [Icmadophila ericetorum]